MTGPEREGMARWEAPAVVSGFARSAPNEVLMAFVEQERAHCAGLHVVDLGCGAGRNSVPMARLGCHVVGTDLAWPMLLAAREKAVAWAAAVQPVAAAMEQLPFADASFDLVVAHGIWNLARSGAIFRAALREAARVARPGAGLFLFTFSRHTLSPDAVPVEGESFVFTDFSGQPECFLTEAQVRDELAAAGFTCDTDQPLTEYNRPQPGLPFARTGPVIYEGTFHRTSAGHHR